MAGRNRPAIPSHPGFTQGYSGAKEPKLTKVSKTAILREFGDKVTKFTKITGFASFDQNGKLAPEYPWVRHGNVRNDSLNPPQRGGFKPPSWVYSLHFAV